jgi:ArsR family transcriptional regulator
MVTSSRSTASDPTHPLVISKFKALADPIRFEVIELLRQGEMCVCDLCDRLDVAQSKLSFHLKALRQANLISARQDGRWVYYSLNLAAFDTLSDYLADLSHCRPCQPAQPCSPSGRN